MDDDLRRAIVMGNFEYVEEYINKHGVSSLEVKDEYGWTPLYYASYGKCLDMIKYLLSKEANINTTNDDGWTPLYLAVYNNQIETTEYLLSKGANINSKSNNGWTPLHSAVFGDRFELVKLLLTHGADREIRNNDNSMPINLTEDKKIIELLETWQGLLEIKEPDI